DQMIAITDVGGDERLQLHLVSSGGEVMRPLTDDLSAIHHFGAWSPDGRRIAYVSNARDGRAFDVYVRDLDRDVSELVLETDGPYRVSAFAPDGERLLLACEESSANADLYELTL